jgi:hypothetical protein
MSDKITGSCLCRAVKYIVNGPIKAVANCHCNTCKKATGSVFGTIAVIDENDFEIIEGQDFLTTYQVSEKATKYFCRICGAPVFNRHKKYPGNYMTQVGSFDDPSLAAPAINIFCENMLPWVKTIADLKCFEREPTK